MDYKKNRRLKPKHYFIIACFVLIIIFKKELNFIKDGIGAVFYGAKSSFYSFTSAIKESTGSFVSSKKVLEENHKLKNEIYKLKIENIKIKEMEKENMRLREILQMKQESGVDFMVAKVAFRDPMSLYETLYINKGEIDGIKKDMIVLFKDMLVGRIVNVEPYRSRVDLVTKKNYSVSVISEDGKNLGVLRGQNNNILTMEYVVMDNSVKEGDILVTSGLSEIYPKGILAGKITKLEKINGNTFKDMEVKLPYDIIYMDELIVLK